MSSGDGGGVGQLGFSYNGDIEHDEEPAAVRRDSRVGTLIEVDRVVSFQTFPGDRGANQAVAAARLGGSVSRLGKLGTDDFETRLGTANSGEQSGEQIRPNKAILPHLRVLAPICKLLGRLKRVNRGRFSKPPPSASRPPLRRAELQFTTVRGVRLRLRS
jgi:hypothetical protein